MNQIIKHTDSDKELTEIAIKLFKKLEPIGDNSRNDIEINRKSALNNRPADWRWIFAKEIDYAQLTSMYTKQSILPFLRAVQTLHCHGDEQTQKLFTKKMQDTIETISQDVLVDIVKNSPIKNQPALVEDCKLAPPTVMSTIKKVFGLGKRG